MEGKWRGVCGWVDNLHNIAYVPQNKILPLFCHNTAPKGNGVGMKMAGCSSMTICHCPQQHWGNGNWSCTTYHTTYAISLAQSAIAEEGGDLLG